MVVAEASQILIMVFMVEGSERHLGDCFLSQVDTLLEAERGWESV